MDAAARTLRRVVGRFVAAERHLDDLWASHGLAVPKQQRDWVLLFERHPEQEVVDVNTLPDTRRVLQQLRLLFAAPARQSRLQLLYFAASGGSGKSRMCGQLAELVLRVRLGDHDAVAAVDVVDDTPLIDQPIPENPTASTVPLGNLSLWVAQLIVLGITFNSSRWGLSEVDRDLATFGIFVPLYLRIFFFARGDLASPTSPRAWQQLCKECLVLLKDGLITPSSLAAAVKALLEDQAGDADPRRPLVILVDEVQKVTDFFAVSTAAVGGAYRSEICTLMDGVRGYAVFTSVSAALMEREMSASKRPTSEVLRLACVSPTLIFEEALRQNALRGVYLSFAGALASWNFGHVLPDGGLAARGVDALTCLVGSDVRFATFLAIHLMEANAGEDAIWDIIHTAADRVAFSVNNLWAERYGPVALAHVLLGVTVLSAGEVMDGAGGRLGITWGEVQQRGHVMAYGGKRFTPTLPLYALWALAAGPRVLDNMFIYRAIRKMLGWKHTTVSWCGWEQLYPACLMALDNARSLVFRGAPTSSLATLFRSSSYVGHGLLLTDCSIETAQPRFNVLVTQMKRLMAQFLAKDGRLVNNVYRLNQGATAIDAAMVYTTVDGEQVMLVFQLKFSTQAASSVVSWNDCCAWVSAMQSCCSHLAGTRWSEVSERVAFVIAARRHRGASLPHGRASGGMKNVIVLCWEDLEEHLGSLLYSLADHAETLFEAEIAEVSPIEQ